MTITGQPRPDQSMSLLADVREGALEPEYRTVGPGRDPSRILRVLVSLVLAALLVFAAVSTTKGADARAAEQRELATLLAAELERREELEDLIAELRADISELSQSQIADPQLVERLALLEPVTGAVPVVGPGIVVRADDAPSLSGQEGLVLDSDLTQLVNGLWQAGAEAVAINGRRITTTTPIRAAGAAITVDYVSLSPPYRIEAIGDPAALQARFARTSAASWWFHISRSYGIGFEIDAAADELELAAVPHLQLMHATKGD